MTAASPPLRVVHLATHDATGGAAKATWRIHDALRSAGCDSRLVVRNIASTASDAVQIARPTASHVVEAAADRFVRRVYDERAQMSYDWLGASRSALRAAVSGAHVVNLHWTQGFVNARNVADLWRDAGRPALVWTLMDAAPLTGGCHYPGACDAFTRSCGACPLLASHDLHDPTWLSLRRKRRHLDPLPIVVVAPTSWVEDRVRASALFGTRRVARIPIAVDPNVFHDREGDAGRDAARALLGLTRTLGASPSTTSPFFSSPLSSPRSARRRAPVSILLGAAALADERKGMRFLVEALARMRAMRGTRDVTLLVAGNDGDGLLARLPFAAEALGFLAGDEKLSAAYRAADLFVCPSVEDAGPMMVNESLLSGTPVVAFRTGAAADLVDDGVTGALARPRDAADLAAALARAVDMLAGEPAVRDTTRARALARCSSEVVAQQYRSLYNELARP